jgi:hypothetical protein
MPERHGCQRTGFADVGADLRLQAAVEATRCGRWLEENGLKWRAERAIPRRQSYERGGQPSRKQKDKPPEATPTPAAAQAEIEQLKKALAETKENARNETHAAASKLRRQEDELQELRRMLQLAHNKITVVQTRLDRLERPPPSRPGATSAQKAVHPAFGRSATRMSPVFAPAIPVPPPTSTPTGTGQPQWDPGRLVQFSPTKPPVPETEQPGHGDGGPSGPAAPAETPGMLSVMPQLATPPLAHPEGPSSAKRHAPESPGSALSPMKPSQLFKSYTAAYSEGTPSDVSDTEFFDRDGSDVDQ